MCDRQVVRGGTSADSVSFIPLCRAPLPPCADWHGSAALHSAWSRALDPMCVCAFVRRGRLPPVFSSRGFFSCQSSHPSTCQRPTRGWQRTVLSSTCCAASCCLRTFWPARLLHVCFPFALSFLGDIARVCTLFFSMMSWRTRLLSWVLCLCMHKSNLFMTIPHRRISPRLQRDLPPSARCIAISLGLLVVTLLDVNLEKVGYSVGLRMLRSPAGRALMH